jgi:hypothetical protein
MKGSVRAGRVAHICFQALGKRKLGALVVSPASPPDELLRGLPVGAAHPMIYSATVVTDIRVGHKLLQNAAVTLEFQAVAYRMQRSSYEEMKRLPDSRCLMISRRPQRPANPRCRFPYSTAPATK